MRLRTLAWLVAITFAACSSDNGSTDGGDDAHSGGGDPVGNGDDNSTSGDSKQGDTYTPAGDETDPYRFPIEISHHDGIPAVALKTLTFLTSNSRFSPPGSHLPARITGVKFWPTGVAWTATLRIKADSGGSPGTSLGQAAVTVATGDLDKELIVDLESQNIMVSGDFWVTITWGGTVIDGQEAMLGTTSTTGRSSSKRFPNAAPPPSTAVRTR